jgi:hypothetical protein
MTFEQWAQSRLSAHQFPVTVDGKIGPDTIAAIRAFQTACAAKGLLKDVNGRLDGPTVMALKMQSSAITRDQKFAIGDRDLVDGRDYAPVTADRWPRQADCMSFYGKVGENQTQIEVPFDMFLAWSKSTRIRKITVHQKVAESALAALQEIGGNYSTKEKADLGIDLFGGSLNVRRMRGGTAYSMHSWGIAIDFDPERNQLHWGHEQARLAQPDALDFFKAWERQGWLSLGRARDFDWMHVQAARL